MSSAFHHLPAKELGNLEHALEADVLICSDRGGDAGHGRPRTSGSWPATAGRGGLAAAAPMEAFTAVLLQLNRRYKTRVAPVFRGIDS